MTPPSPNPCPLDPLAAIQALLRAADILAEHAGDDAGVHAVSRAIENSALSYKLVNPLVELGLQRGRGGVRPWRQAAIKKRNALLHRIYQEHYADLGPTAAARAIHAAWRRAATTATPRGSGRRHDENLLLHVLCDEEGFPPSIRTIISVLRAV